MIRIHKPASAPEILTTAGAERCAEHVADVAAGREIEFDRNIYAAAEVIAALRRAQHDKCCYCEKLLEQREMDIDHFRPKAECRQGYECAIERPGYFWLAYEWSNLYLACRPCNQVHKGVLFPLLEPTARLRGPGVAQHEDPLLIDPGREDPEAHIDFNEAEVCRRNDSTRGAITIRVLELGRPGLNDMRRHYFEPFRMAIRLLACAHDGERALADQDIQDLCSIIANASRLSAPFAAMVRAALRRQFRENLRLPLSATDLLHYVGGGGLPHT